MKIDEVIETEMKRKEKLFIEDKIIIISIFH